MYNGIRPYAYEQIFFIFNRERGFDVDFLFARILLYYHLNFVEMIAKFLRKILESDALVIIEFIIVIGHIFHWLKSFFDRVIRADKILRNWLTMLLKIQNLKLIPMERSLMYGYLKITPEQLIQRIENSNSSALRFNSFIDGAIVTVPVGNEDGEILYQRFERVQNQFRDLGICTN